LQTIPAVLALLVLVVWASPAQSPDEKGKAVRKAFMVCQAANWKGKAEIQLPEPSDVENGGADVHLRLDCSAYLSWWDNTDKPSPFAVWHKGDQAGSPIPPEEWMKYLRYLPTLNANRAAN
jgi:hypothetical protein